MSERIRHMSISLSIETNKRTIVETLAHSSEVENVDELIEKANERVHEIVAEIES